MASVSFSKLVPKFSLLAGVIFGSLLVASNLFPSSSLRNSQSSQFIDSYESPQQVEPVNRGAVLALAFGASAAVCLGANAMLDRKRSLTIANQPHSNSSSQTRPPENMLRGLNTSLQRKLLLLLHQDQKAAERLLKQVTLKFPGQSPNWYGEKVIYDLERDRGRV